MWPPTSRRKCRSSRRVCRASKEETEHRATKLGDGCDDGDDLDTWVLMSARRRGGKDVGIGYEAKLPMDDKGKAGHKPKDEERGNGGAMIIKAWGEDISM